MNTFYSLILYAAIGGFIYGLAHNAASDRCGKAIPVASDMPEAIVTWPALIVMALVAGDSIDSEYSCEDRK